MHLLETSEGLVRDPLAWAADCAKQADSEADPEARDAFTQLAQEFASISSEIEGLISTFEALSSRRPAR